MPTPQLEQPTTPADVSRYAELFRRDGYVRLPAVFSADELAALRDEAAAQMEGGRGEPIEHFGTRLMADGREVQMRVDWPIDKRLRNDSFLAASAHPVIRAFASELFDPPVLGMDSLVFKALEGGPMVGMHSLRHGHRDLPADGRVENANIGVYLDDAPLEGGCLMVVPGSQLLPYEEVEPLQNEQFDGPGVVTIPASAGDVVVHSEFVVHGSKETGPGPSLRRVLYLSHHAPDWWPDPARATGMFARMLRADEVRAAAPYAAGETPRPARAFSR